MNSHYTVLRAISTVYRMLAALLFLLSIALMIFVLLGHNVPLTFIASSNDPAVRIATGVLVSVVGALIAIGLFAMAELIHLLVEIAMNTRSTDAHTRQLVTLAERQLIALQSAPPAPPAPRN